MTTAARPTFEPARGGRGKGEGDLSQLSKQYSSRDLPSHTKIKYRQTTQDAPEEVRNRDFRRELEERERAAAREKNRDRPTREHTTSSSVSKKPRLDQIPAANLDADDPLTDEEDEDEDFEEESDDDDTAALLAELEKIKKERAEEQARKEQEQKAEEERIRMENILSGNPLLNLTGPSQPQANFKVKRRFSKIMMNDGRDPILNHMLVWKCHQPPSCFSGCPRMGWVLSSCRRHLKPNHPLPP
ncbi:spliceosome-associated protein CWC15 homolog isoform X2 [Manis pentadactyla]|uniref:spliceosome-associated protein CWC15 homolog isoform X2 n=1 Tax=Manis pentadactyla TaxID=143292 RepID=UPI00255C5054|nr:spliceosome-associated protein CWC15 homolog isoform X2 [Manis pentadactyla]